MNRTVFIDTNTLLDACMSERPHWAYAAMLLDEISFGKLEACISATSLKDAYYVLTKYAGEKAARDFVLAALDAFTVVGVDAAVCRLAARSNEPDFEDGIVRACAENAGVDFIISRNDKAFRASFLKRLDAREYVELFCDAEGAELGK